MDQFEIFLNTYGLLAIFTLLLVKGIGVPIPIPSDAIMLVAAARAAEGRLDMTQAFAAILVALVGGGTMQFFIVCAAGRSLLYRFGGILGLTPTRLDHLSAKMRGSNPVGIGLAILTPGVRSVAIPACGISGVPLRAFVIGLALGSALFLALHFFLGFAGRSLLASLGIPLPLAIGLLAVIAVAGLIAWIVIRRRRRPEASTGELIAEAYQCWHEATCPACLALAVASRIEGNPIQSEHHRH